MSTVGHRPFWTLNRIKKNLSIFTAEVYAILVALRHSLQQKKNRITILTDSMSCIKAVENMTDSNPMIARIANILQHTKKEIVLCWLPSHVGIFGHDQADRRAGRAIKIQEIEDMYIPIHYMKRKMDKNINREWQRLWDNIHRY